MPFPPFAPSIFFEDDELRDLIAEFSERLRTDRRLRPMLDHLIGNRWLEAEQGAEAFLRATLFLDAVPAVDQQWLGRAVELLGPEEIEALYDAVLDCSLAAFPLQGAAVVAEVADRLAEYIKSIAKLYGDERREQLGEIVTKLRAGGLMNRY